MGFQKLSMTCDAPSDDGSLVAATTELGQLPHALNVQLKRLIHEIWCALDEQRIPPKEQDRPAVDNPCLLTQRRRASAESPGQPDKAAGGGGEHEQRGQLGLKPDIPAVVHTSLALRPLQGEVDDLNSTEVTPHTSFHQASEDPISLWGFADQLSMISKGTEGTKGTKQGQAIELRQVWTQAQESIKKTNRCGRYMLSSSSSASASWQEVLNQELGPQEPIRRTDSFLGRHIMHPGCKRRMIWDFLSISIVMYEIVTIPLQFFNMEALEASGSSSLPLIMARISLGLWTMDIFMSFMVGYYKRGVLEMRPHALGIHYMVTWFPVDIVLVCLDWAITITSARGADNGSVNGTKIGKIGRTMRTLRILRSLRLLRLLKLRHLIEELEDNVSNEYILIILRVAKLIAVIVLINHFVACCWYGMSRMGGGQGGWVHASGLEQAPVEYLYVTSMHWSLTQFTPASMEIHPNTVQERTFAVAVLLFALVVFSSFVSSITSAMTSLRELSSQMFMTKEFSKLKWYLRDNDVTGELAVRIKKYLSHALSERKHRVKPADVELLSWLSEPLMMEMKSVIFGRVLLRHGFFKHYTLCSKRALDQLCSRGAVQIFVSNEDMLFSSGETATGMYFLCDGLLLYNLATAFGESSMVVKAGEVLCEMALWINWVHCGELRAASHASLMIIDPEQFARITSQHAPAMQYAQAYAAEYVSRLQTLREFDRSDLSLNDGDYAEEVFSIVCPVQSCSSRF